MLDNKLKSLPKPIATITESDLPAAPTNASLGYEGTTSEVTAYGSENIKLNDIWTVVGIVFNGIDIVRLYKDQFNRHKFDNKGDLTSAIETWK